MEYFFSCSHDQTTTLYSSFNELGSPLDENGPENMPPEQSDGNVEYKLKLLNPSPARLQHLISQMKWRLREGHGEAVYEIGVQDNGICRGLTKYEFDSSVNTLKRMAAELLNASVTLLREKIVGEGEVEKLKVAEFLIRRIPDSQQATMLGSDDSGKSTLLGVLTQGELDNGRGKSRLNLFRHLHEVLSGRTSSISFGIVGFDNQGIALNRRQHCDEEICNRSEKVITFIDLAGHEKYMRTTISGLSAYKPHFVVLVVDPKIGIGNVSEKYLPRLTCPCSANTTMDHLSWSFALEVPVFIVVTKVDIATQQIVDKVVDDIENALKNPPYRRVAVRVKNDDDVFVLGSNFRGQKLVPIFTVSNVTGESIEQLLKFLYVLPPRDTKRQAAANIQEDVEFQIDDVFCVPGVGHVVSGLLTRGVLREGDRLLLGPNQQGDFKSVVVKSMQRIRVPCRVVQAAQFATVSIGDLGDFQLRKGMVLIGRSRKPVASWTIRADVFVMYHASGCIAENFQVTLHIGNVCQTAVITQVHNQSRTLKSHESASVTLTFIRQPEFITPESRLLFRHGKTKGIGVVREVNLNSNITFPCETTNELLRPS
ncbi:GTP binding protein 2 [Trichuris trichiura]|uniref:GTP binding protein 2 n=1 Tax=Trichuris trichiura TaxID=36087 RepID=A0A077ZE73_TRITR|nr:GTP binding protein 2 [Trichuris trichiura]